MGLSSYSCASFFSLSFSSSSILLRRFTLCHPSSPKRRGEKRTEANGMSHSSVRKQCHHQRRCRFQNCSSSRLSSSAEFFHDEQILLSTCTYFMFYPLQDRARTFSTNCSLVTSPTVSFLNALSNICVTETFQPKHTQRNLRTKQNGKNNIQRSRPSSPENPTKEERKLYGKNRTTQSSEETISWRDSLYGQLRHSILDRLFYLISFNL